jgi:hypothetical protein
VVLLLVEEGVDDHLPHGGGRSCSSGSWCRALLRSPTGALKLLAVGVDISLTEADLTDGSHDRSHHDWIFFLVGSEAVTVPRYVLINSLGVAYRV